jgi:hypothetical protein
MRGTLALCVVLLWSGLQAPAQDAAPSDSAAGKSITIQTDVDSAIVFIDSLNMGQTPLVVKDMQPGFHRLKIVHPDVTNWLTGSILDSVQIHPGEERVLRYSFGRRYLLLSIPSGADVFIEDSLSGSTPFLVTFQGKDSIPSITLKKPGYETANANLSESRRGVATVTLKKLWGPDSGLEQSEEMSSEQKSGTLRVYLAGAVAVGFGAAAAYFKIQADDRNDQYLANQASSGRSQIRVYDTASAICLTFAEVGFGFFTYLLLAE